LKINFYRRDLHGGHNDTMCERNCSYVEFLKKCLNFVLSNLKWTSEILVENWCTVARPNYKTTKYMLVQPLTYIPTINA